MRDHIKLVKRCKADIEDLKALIYYTKKNPSYIILDKEEERETDLNSCNIVLKDFYNEYHTHLENLQAAIEKEKNWISQEQKKLIIRNHEQQV